MKIIKIYHNTLEDESIVNSFAHPLGAEGSYTLSYWLIADKDKKVSQLSGGMARRTAIARATAFDGDIFFIDEPLYGLDAKTSQGILEMIKSTVKNKTAFIITHSPEEAFFLADRIIFIDSKPVTGLRIADKNHFSCPDEIKAELL